MQILVFLALREAVLHMPEIVVIRAFYTTIYCLFLAHLKRSHRLIFVFHGSNDVFPRHLRPFVVRSEFLIFSTIFFAKTRVIPFSRNVKL